MPKLNNSFIAPKKVSYTDFPISEEAPAGMQPLDVDLTPTFPKVILNTIYANKNGLSLHLHIILPAAAEEDPQARFPLIMWVQGSAFHKQSLGAHLAHMIDVAKHGYVVAMVEYRWAPENPFPAQVQDLNTATRFMLQHADQYHVDSKKYLAWGDSSGGHTVSLGCVTSNLPMFNDEDSTVFPLHFAGCIDYYGPTDISRMNKVPSTQDHVTAHSLEGEFFGTNNVNDIPKMVQSGNPISYIKDEPLPPFLIMHGNKDRLVPFEQSVLLFNALKAHHQSVEFYRLNNSDHGSDAFFADNVLKKTYQFIEKCFQN